MINDLWSNVAAAAIFSVLGIAILALTMMLFQKFFPGHLWKELMDDQNSAFAIVIAGLTIGMSIIIAAAVH